MLRDDTIRAGICLTECGVSHHLTLVQVRPDSLLWTKHLQYVTSAYLLINLNRRLADSHLVGITFAVLVQCLMQFFEAQPEVCPNRTESVKECLIHLLFFGPTLVWL